MGKEYRIGRRLISVNDTVIDRVVNYFASAYGAKRLRSRLVLELAGLAREASEKSASR